jgi:serine/threonine-protein kinase
MLRSRVRPFLRRSTSLPTEAAGSAPPDAFGPYRVLHQIGAGTLGPVFRAYDPDQDKLVAVKLFRLDLPPERVHQFVAELERLITADLTHPAIAAPLVAGIANVTPYLAQDFVAADSLDTVVREHGAAPPGEAIRIVTQLAGALDFAAVVDVVHGALHPRDVLISPDDARITGLGITRALESVGVQAPVRRPYTAPERAAGGPWDRRADVFSLVALAHELLWGRRIAALGAEAAAALGDIPGAQLAALRIVFGRGLADNPSKRFATALEFADALKSSFTRESLRPGAGEGRRSADPLLPLGAADADASVATRPRQADANDTVPIKAPATGGIKGVAPIPPAPDADDTIATGEEEHEDIEVATASSVGETPAPPDDLALRAAETARFADAESAPSVIDPPLERTEPSDGVERHALHAADAKASVPPEERSAAERPASLGNRGNLVNSERPVTLAGHAVHAEPPVSPVRHDPARSAIWPLSLALIVGLALGFAGGYGLGQSERRSEGAAVADGPNPGTEGRLPAPMPAGTSETEVRLKADAISERDATALQPELAARASASAANVAPPPTVPLAVEPAPPKPAPAPPAVARTGRLTVRTTPAGARVLIDGRDVGKTPLTVPSVARGAHTVRVTRDGYAAQERRVNITAAQPAATLTLRLARAAAPTPPRAAAAAGRQTASLLVESRPDGASVIVDGKRVGTTPISIPSLAIGAHAVRLEMAGYRPWTASVRVVAGEKNRVAASLEQ